MKRLFKWVGNNQWFCTSGVWFAMFVMSLLTFHHIYMEGDYNDAWLSLAMAVLSLILGVKAYSNWRIQAIRAECARHVEELKEQLESLKK